MSDLSRRFVLATTPVSVGEREIELVHPRSAEDLISEEDFERDERLPYWADIWPSAVVLARRTIAADGGGRRLLELGCGIGLVTVAASLAGFDVTATDYYDDALLFAAENVRRNGAGTIRTRMVDWRDFPDDLGRFDMVVASDVLYERPYGALVAAAFARALAPDGRGWLTDPGRVAAGDFVRACESLGLDARRAERVPFDTGAAVQTIDVYEIRWR